MNRRGFTLVEMLVVLTIGAVLVGISVGALHLLLRTERTGRDHIPQTRILLRLAEQFRNDAGRALDQNVSKKEMEFMLPDDCLVTYKTLPGKMTRIERHSGKPIQQESYALPDGCATKFAMNYEGDTTLSILLINMPTKPGSVNREMRVVAVLGKNHRFTSKPAEEP